MARRIEWRRLARCLKGETKIILRRRQQFFDPRGVFVQLHLDDLVEAAIDGGKTFVHLFAETTDLNAHVANLIVHLGAETADLKAHVADLIAYVSADVLALFFDETRKLLEFGLFILRHVGQYTILTNLAATRLAGAEARASNLQRDGGFSRPRICKRMGELRSGVER
jgi:hypothetical protein